MKGPRCDRILAGMNVAVILTAFFSVFAKGDDLTAVSTGASPAGQSTETSSAPTAPASESPAATIDATPAKSTDPVSAIEQNVGDPLASLDPADRAVAEKIRDLLAAKPDAIFASKSERKAVEILLSESNPRSPLARQRRSECARDGGDCAPQGGRCRWPRSKRLSHTQFYRAWPRRTRRGRSQAYADGVDLRPASASRAFPLQTCEPKQYPATASTSRACCNHSPQIDL